MDEFDPRAAAEEGVRAAYGEDALDDKIVT
jgi:hypothetical protein